MSDDLSKQQQQAYAAYNYYCWNYPAAYYANNQPYSYASYSQMSAASVQNTDFLKLAAANAAASAETSRSKEKPCATFKKDESAVFVPPKYRSIKYPQTEEEIKQWIEERRQKYPTTTKRSQQEALPESKPSGKSENIRKKAKVVRLTVAQSAAKSKESLIVKICNRQAEDEAKKLWQIIDYLRKNIS